MVLVLAALPDLSHTVGFTPEQKLWLLGAWLLFFLVPALVLRAHAVKRGRDWKRWFVLTLVGSFLGPLEYWEHNAVTKRRAERAARKRAEGAESDPDAAVRREQ